MIGFLERGGDLVAVAVVLLFGGRLNFPVSYVNACSALFVIGFWPAVVIAAQRQALLATRAAATGADAVLGAALAGGGGGARIRRQPGASPGAAAAVAARVDVLEIAHGALL